MEVVIAAAGIEAMAVVVMATEEVEVMTAAMAVVAIEIVVMEVDN